MNSSQTLFEDSTLIKLTLEGQVECFAELMDRHFGAVRKRIGLMVRNPTDAEDVLQEVQLKVWRHLSTFRSGSTFRTWITRVAINEALQLFRRQQRRPAYQPLDDVESFVCASETPYQSCARVQRTQAVRKAVEKLPSDYKEVVILHDFKQLSARETAQRLESSIPAVKTRLFRARRMLLAALIKPEPKRKQCA